MCIATYRPIKNPCTAQDDWWNDLSCQEQQEVEQKEYEADEGWLGNMMSNYLKGQTYGK